MNQIKGFQFGQKVQGTSQDKELCNNIFSGALFWQKHSYIKRNDLLEQQVMKVQIKILANCKFDSFIYSHSKHKHGRIFSWQGTFFLNLSQFLQLTYKNFPVMIVQYIEDVFLESFMSKLNF